MAIRRALELMHHPGLVRYVSECKPIKLMATSVRYFCGGSLTLVT